MSAPEMDLLTVERRLGRVRALLVAMNCIADKAERDGGIAGGAFCADIEVMAQDELGKVEAVLGLDVMNRDC